MLGPPEDGIVHGMALPDEVLRAYGFPVAAKEVMRMVGVDCGPVRAPQRPLTREQAHELHAKLDAAGFFEWVRLPAANSHKVMANPQKFAISNPAAV